MRKILQFVIACTLFAGSAWGQTCSIGPVQSQSDINNFRKAHPGCQVISGSLDIISTNVTNLDSLRDIRLIEGSVHINHNLNLVSIAGLIGLEQVNGEINIEDNDNLPDLHGLENFSRPQGNVRVVYNERLTSVAALSRITRVPGFLSVGANPIMTSLAGLENITRVESSISIALNSSLVDFKPLSKLTYVGNYFYLGFNTMVKDLTGLGNLQYVGERFEITDCTGLTSLNGLGPLSSVAAIIIKNNTSLTNCAILPLCQRIDNGNFGIYNNAPGCNSVSEIRSRCSPAPVPLARINAGGSSFTTKDGRTFSDDKYYGGIDRVHSVGNYDIAGTDNDQLYTMERSATSFSYAVPLIKGKYNVTLHFAEIWFGAPGGRPGGKGLRQFNIDVEGARKFTNYDVFARAGGAMTALTEQFTVSVTDGVLNLDFTSGAANLPTLAALEIVPAPADQILTFLPEADALVRNGPYADQNFGSDPVLTAKANYSPGYHRRSYLRFRIPGVNDVVSAKLRVYGYNAEAITGTWILAVGVYDDSWQENTITWNNAPVYGPTTLEGRAHVRGTPQYWEMDVTPFVAAQAAEDQVVSLALFNASNNNLVYFNSRENPAGSPPQLVIRTYSSTNLSARTGLVTEVPAEAAGVNASIVYPNPAKSQFTIRISPRHAEDVSLELTSTKGQKYAITQSLTTGNTLQRQVDFSSAKPASGIYILKIRSSTMVENVKVLVAE